MLTELTGKYNHAGSVIVPPLGDVDELQKRIEALKKRGNFVVKLQLRQEKDIARCTTPDQAKIKRLYAEAKAAGTLMIGWGLEYDPDSRQSEYASFMEVPFEGVGTVSIEQGLWLLQHAIWRQLLEEVGVPSSSSAAGEPPTLDKPKTRRTPPKAVDASESPA